MRRIICFMLIFSMIFSGVPTDSFYAQETSATTPQSETVTPPTEATLGTVVPITDTTYQFTNGTFLQTDIVDNEGGYFTVSVNNGTIEPTTPSLSNISLVNNVSVHENDVAMTDASKIAFNFTAQTTYEEITQTIESLVFTTDGVNPQEVKVDIVKGVTLSDGKSDIKKIDDKYYSYFETENPLTYEESNFAATSQGGLLAKPTTTEETQKIADSFKDYKYLDSDGKDHLSFLNSEMISTDYMVNPYAVFNYPPEDDLENDLEGDSVQPYVLTSQEHTEKGIVVEFEEPFETVSINEIVELSDLSTATTSPAAIVPFSQGTGRVVSPTVGATTFRGNYYYMDINVTNDMVNMSISVDSGHITLPAGITATSYATEGIEFSAGAKADAGDQTPAVSTSEIITVSLKIDPTNPRCNELLDSIKYYPKDATTDQEVKISTSTLTLQPGDKFYGGHIYRYVDGSTITPPLAGGAESNLFNAVAHTKTTAMNVYPELGTPYLATLTTEEENNFVVPLIPAPMNSNFAFLGMLAYYNGGTKVTTADLAGKTLFSQLTGFSSGTDGTASQNADAYYWFDGAYGTDGQPNGPGSEVGMKVQGTGGAWDPWISEKPTYKSTGIEIGWVGAAWSDDGGYNTKDVLVEWGRTPLGYDNPTTVTTTKTIDTHIMSEGVSANEYYVDDDAPDDTGLGTPSDPFKTIPTAQAKSLETAGVSTIYIMSDYYPNPTEKITAGGSNVGQNVVVKTTDVTSDGTPFVPNKDQFYTYNCRDTTSTIAQVVGAGTLKFENINFQGGAGTGYALFNSGGSPTTSLIFNNVKMSGFTVSSIVVSTSGTYTVTSNDILDNDFVTPGNQSIAGGTEISGNTAKNTSAIFDGLGSPNISEGVVAGDGGTVIKDNSGKWIIRSQGSKPINIDNAEFVGNTVSAAGGSIIETGNTSGIATLTDAYIHDNTSTSHIISGSGKANLSSGAANNMKIENNTVSSAITNGYAISPSMQVGVKGEVTVEGNKRGTIEHNVAIDAKTINKEGALDPASVIYFSLTAPGKFPDVAGEEVEIVKKGTTGSSANPNVSELGCFKVDANTDTAPIHAPDTVSNYIKADNKMYVKYNEINHTVTFDTQGATSDAIANESVAYGANATKPADPTKPGFTFDGWDTAVTGGTDWIFDTHIITADITLYAQWKTNHTVTFDTHGGSAEASQSISPGGMATKPLNDPTKEGHTFAGWHDLATDRTEWNFGNPITADTTIHAQWTKNNYTVTFDTQGATSDAIANESVAYGANATKPTDPTKPGFTFDGWDTAVTGGTDWIFDTHIITADRTLYAQWKTNHTVTFDTHGGSAEASQSISPGGMATKPLNYPTKEGHTFAGWYDLATDGTEWNFGNPITADTTIHAQWTKNNYTVTFDTQGATSDAIANESVAYGANATKPADPIKPGFTFDGWDTAVTGGTDWIFDTHIITTDRTLYAQWKTNHTVTFDTHGGSAEASQSISPGGMATKPLNDPTKEGHTFAGWHKVATGNDPWVFTTEIVAADTTIHAQWTKNNYTVTFDTQGATSDAIANESVAYGANATKPADPIKPGFTFDGWDTAVTGGTDWIFDTHIITTDRTLYAQWKTNHTVTFDTHGGSAEASQSISPGGMATKPLNDPTKEGHTFAGWHEVATGNDPWVFTTEIVTADTTIHAQWTKNNYTVTFDTQGATSDAIANESVAYGANATKPADPIKPGFTFDGWDTAVTGGTDWIFDTHIITTDRTLYAQWKTNHTVTFDTHGGSAEASQSISPGGKATKPLNDPTKEGHTFAGWHKVATGNDPWVFTTEIVAADATIHAQWTKNNYTVTFDTQGATSDAIANESVAYGANATKPADPTKPGFTFDGWDTAVTGGTDWIFDTEPVTTDITLYAQWKTNHTVTFDTHGGSAEASQSISPGGMATKPLNDPTKEGHTFAGWHDLATDGTEWNFGNPITADTTIHAQWTKNNYTVTFDTQGATSDAIANESVAYGANATKPADPTKPGFTFDGWDTAVTGGTDWIFATEPVTTDITLYAQWKTNHTVTFDTHGGSAEASQSISPGGKATKPLNDPTKEGHTFAGWHDLATDRTEWNFSNPITADTTIHAQWTKNNYTVTFDTQGATSDAIANESVAYGANATKPTDPTKPGFTFDGWDTAVTGGTDWIFDTHIITADRTLYAQWKTNHTVTFDTHSGSAEASQSISPGGMATKPLNDPTKEGHTFAGWHKVATGNDPWVFTTEIVTADTTIHAQWTKNNYTVTFDTQGATSDAIANESVAYGANATKPADPTKPGFTFDGWDTAVTGGTDWIFDTHIITADRTLYAQWKTNHTVTFDTHGGSAEASQSISPGGMATKPLNDPTKEGHTFAGWHKVATGNDPWVFATEIVTSDTTIHAQWTKNNYTVTFDTQGATSDAIANESVAYGANATKPADPTKPGFTFDGWDTAVTGGTDWIFATEPVTTDITLYAQWKTNHTVTFDTHGGSAEASQSISPGGMATKPLNDPTKEGHTFAGWHKVATGNDPWVFTTEIVAADTTIHAQWTKNNYTVTFDTQGATSDAIANESVAYGANATKPSDPTKPGFTFDGWDTAVTGGTDWIFDTHIITADRTLYAQWKTNHTVTFDTHGGSGEASQSISPGGMATKPLNDPTKEGHTFAGWHKVATGNDPWVFTTEIVAADTTIHAQWTKNNYTVTFDTQGATSDAIANESVAYGANATKPADPTKPGFTFDGWDTAVTGGTDWIFDTHIITADRTLYAQWKTNHTVTFDTHGGSAEASQSISPGGMATKPLNDPTKEGHTFAGWHDLATDGTEWNFGNPITADTTIHAQWTKNNYTVTFDTQGATSDAIANESVAYGANATKPTDPTKEGHTFDGWDTAVTGGTDWIFDTHIITADRTLYAQWKTNHTVTFDTHGGSAEASQSISPGGMATKPLNDPTKEGHTFAGWHKVATGNDPWVFTTEIVTADTTIHAQWTKNNYTVTFDTQGATSDAIANESVAYGANATKPADPTKPGFTFDGWDTAVTGGTDWIFATHIITADRTLYAQWKTNHTVTFDTHGGSAEASQSISPGGMATKPLNDPTKEGHTFAGWHKVATGNDPWVFATEIVTSDTTIHAQWTKNNYTVTFDTQGATSDAIANESVAYGANATKPADPTKPGFTFDGWDTAVTGGTDWIFATEPVTTDITLYAQWKTNHTVTFDTHGGSAEASQSISPGGMATKPLNDPTKEGHTFAGWHKVATGNDPWVFTTEIVAADTTIHAQWTKNNYTVTFDTQGATSDAIANESVAYGANATKPSDPTKPGFTFDGWDTAVTGGTDWIFDTHIITADRTLYAQWKTNHTVTFDTHGGSAEASQSISPGGMATKPLNDPTKEGHTFAGWHDLATDGTEWNFGNPITTDTTIHAQWTKNNYTVTFDTQGATSDAIANESVAYGANATKPSDPTKPGFTFDGWDTAVTGGTDWIFDTHIITADRTLYAQWKTNHTVTFDTHGGSAEASQSISPGGMATKPLNDPTKEGHTFAGWHKVATGNDPWVFATEIVTADTTIHAQWTKNNYTVTFDTQGATSDAIANESVAYGANATKPADPTKPGFTFDGWDTAVTGGTDWIFDTHIITADRTLYAQWKTNHTVTFDTHGGSAEASQSISPGGMATKPLNDPTKEGHTFAGWHKVATGNDPWVFTTEIVATDTTIHAQWTKNNYTVTFDTQGATSDAIANESVAYGANATKPTDPTKEGHTFDGWDTAVTGGTDWIFATEPVTTDITLYAQWKTNHTITFDTHGGSGEASQSISPGGMATKPLNDPTKEGHTFAGWHKVATGNDPWVFTTEIVATDTTIHAQWTKNNYTVTFDTQGATSDAIANESVAYGANATKPTDPIKPGFTFDGWDTAVTGGTDWIFDTHIITADRTLYAQWKTNHTVTFDTHGGSGEASQSISPGGMATKPLNDPTKEGHTFAGWHKVATGNDPWVFTTEIVTADATIHAQWTKNNYTVTFDTQGATSDAIANESVAYGANATKPTDPIKPGFTFDGWDTAVTGGTDWIFATEPVTTDITLYAQWKTNHTVTFDTHGGSAEASQSISPGGMATKPLNDPTKEGHTFAGWHDLATDGTEWNFGNPITTDTTIHAQWTKNNYTVTFDTQGATSDAIANESVAYGANATKPSDPTKPGFTFDGWDTAVTGGTDWIFATEPVTTDITLYAQWKTNHTVTFDTHGGSAEASQSISPGGMATKPLNDPTKEGHTFAGWHKVATGNDPWVFTTEIVAADTTIHAQWTKNNYTVTFDTQGATSDAIANESVAYGANATKPTDPTKPGFTFDGWDTAVTGGTDWIFDTHIITADRTLYAQWKTNHTVTFDTHGGSGEASQSISPGGMATKPLNDPTKEGHTFAGWHKVATGNDPWVFTTEIVAADATIHAQWTKNNYTVTFDTQGATSDAIANESVAYGANATKPADPIKPGFTFDGWDTAVTGGTDWIFATEPVTTDITLYAQWKTNHTVTFDTHGGSAEASQSISPGGMATKPLNDPTKEGHTFAGWHKVATGNDPWVFTTEIVTADTTIHAQWTKNNYTVTFDTQGATSDAIANESVAYGANATKPADPTKPGFTFDGWDTAVTGGTDWIFDTHIITTDITLYAQWKTNHTITFDTHGGSAEASQSISPGGMATKPLNYPTKEGHTFAGWYDLATDGTEWNFGNPITADTTIHAQWTKNNYTVTFDTQGATSDAIANESVAYGANATKPSDPTKPGFTFDGWDTAVTGGTDWIFATEPVTTDITLYAQWKTNHTVTFDTHGGSAEASQSISPGGMATKPLNDPTKEGHTFAGWHDLATDRTEWNFGNPITADTTIHAQWTKNNYTVTFDTQGATSDAIANESVAYGANATKPTDPTKPGFTFDGWDTAVTGGTDWIFDTHIITTDRTLYAQWKTNHTVTFDTHGGSGEASQSISPGGMATKPLNDPTKEGHTFAGWHDLATDGTEWNFGNPITTDTTIHAQWTKNNYTVTFDTQGATSDAIANESVAYGANATKPTDPIKPGFTFDGWDTAVTGGTDWIFDTHIITADRTLYAQWKTNHTVTFDTHGGSGEASQSISPGGMATKPLNDPTKEGHTFAGWHKVATGNDPWVFTTEIVTADTTIHAQWTKNNYTVTFDTQGATSDAIANESVAYGANATKPTDPTKPGFTFDGWDTAVTGGTDWIFDTHIITADRTLYAQWKTNHTVTFDTHGGSAEASQSISPGGMATKPLNDPTKEGHTFAGWHKVATGNDPWVFTTEIVTADTTIHAQWTTIKDTGNSNGNDDDDDDDDAIESSSVTEYSFEKSPAGNANLVVAPANEDENEVSKYLDTSNHDSYLVGYNSEFKPDEYMTRAEVTQIFYNLSLDKDKIEGSEVIFSDVAADAWYKEALDTLSSKGIINGYEDGTFNPNGVITRAEAAYLACQFANEGKGYETFPDVSDNHWASDEIKLAASYGWITGYEDGRFRPDQPITRAEMTVLINNMLNRQPHKVEIDSVVENPYTDISENHWAYYEIMEATVSHDHTEVMGEEIWIDIH